MAMLFYLAGNTVGCFPKETEQDAFFCLYRKNMRGFVVVENTIMAVNKITRKEAIDEYKEYVREMKDFRPCLGCKYFGQCGDPFREKECKGREGIV